MEYSYGTWSWCNLLHVYAVAFDAQEPVLLVGFLEDLEDLGVSKCGIYLTAGVVAVG